MFFFNSNSNSVFISTFNSSNCNQAPEKTIRMSGKGFTKVMSKSKAKEAKDDRARQKGAAATGASKAKSAPLHDVTNQINEPLQKSAPATAVPTNSPIQNELPVQHQTKNSAKTSPMLNSFTSVTDILDQSSTSSDGLELADSTYFPSIEWLAKYEMQVYRWVIDEDGNTVSYAVRLRRDIVELLTAREERRLREIEAASGCPLEIQQEVMGPKVESFLIICGVESKSARFCKLNEGGTHLGSKDWCDGSSSDGYGFESCANEDDNDDNRKKYGCSDAEEEEDVAPLTDSASVTQALQALSGFVYKVLAAKNAFAPPPPSKTYMTTPSGALEIRVVDSAVGFILGINGAKIKALTRKTDTDIQITKR